ncbi:MAG: endopeptidase La [Archangium sp.]|nr:endopeptidase La [Archangium sp.]MDP3152913.1 endopeptidase La [Archangium sp.]MDP3569929.1 endopeptidase La [Archangium sp.]
MSDDKKKAVGAQALPTTMTPPGAINKDDIPQVLPILPLRNSVFFPGGVLPLAVGRQKTIALIKDAVRDDQVIGVVTQRKAEEEDPGATDLYNMGTVARIVKLLKMGEDNYSLVVQGLARFRVMELVQESPYLKARIEPVDDKTAPDNVEIEALTINLKKLAREVIEMMPELPAAATELVESITHPGHLADLIAANVDVPIEEKQAVLETVDLKARMKLVLELLNRKREILKLSNKIDSAVKGEMSKTQREYYLRQQLKAIKEELGEMGEDEEELDELGERLKKAGLPPDVEKVANKELNRLKTIPAASSEYTVARTYLDWIADLPWSKISEDNLDIDNARKQLDNDHYGIQTVKKRVLEYLAVRKLKNDMRGPILCLSGPPGVGKTSLGQSIARAIGRKFVRLSLGGVRDEAEIRGHRRTYVGALPGRFIQQMKKAGSRNPIMLLDEIDKLGSDFRGDPSAALLEVLDPEQNSTFSDHYLDIPFDLSKVMFIATANRLDTIPAPLRDRMEIIEMSSYTFIEKDHIARNHLIPKQIKEHGITVEHIELLPEALDKIISSYAIEPGVRQLERKVAEICRSVAVGVASGNMTKQVITAAKVEEILGAKRHELNVAERTSQTGVSVGLYYTSLGFGDILFVEATKMPGKGSLTLTGQLGEVMKESVNIAFSWLRANAERMGLAPTMFEKTDLHLHFPDGATPKDGPSAGVAIITALSSLFTGIPVRSDTAMTGEITLRGNVGQIGGVREKVLGAHRAGIKRVLLPEKNKKDLVDVPEVVRTALEFHFVAHVDEALKLNLERSPFVVVPAVVEDPKAEIRA